ncbi:uncharacterized protein A4U43_C06F15240 [Asparagus officinalis]|uniref:Eukaryotic translation initiation factor 3 subunit E N-terminal domain-containing protein n=1 Tax=Asparagus officinalis TaxID=4686 RepID=A0A5P1EQI3_ASPOF|nr:uncharacterized protein A4U43_C06F15240 [Asparagus officinalis]
MPAAEPPLAVLQPTQYLLLRTSTETTPLLFSSSTSRRLLHFFLPRLDNIPPPIAAAYFPSFPNSKRPPSLIPVPSSPHISTCSARPQPPLSSDRHHMATALHTVELQSSSPKSSNPKLSALHLTNECVAKIDLKSKTNMVDYAMAIHKNLHHTEEVPQGQIRNPRRAEVVSRLKSKEESAAPLISFLQNSSYVQEHKADKQYNIQMLNDWFKIEALYQYAKFRFECGSYSAAYEFLY